MAAKTGEKREYAVGDKRPPVEHQFKPGNQAAKGHGRPKDLKQLREFIQAKGFEDSTVRPGHTKLEVLVDAMYLSRNSGDRKEILRYGWGEPETKQSNINVPWDELTLEELEAIANGADVLAVLAARRTGEVRSGAEAGSLGPGDASGAPND